MRAPLAAAALLALALPAQAQEERWSTVTNTRGWMGAAAGVHRMVEAGTRMEMPNLVPAGPLLRCSGPAQGVGPEDVVLSPTPPQELRLRASSLIVGLAPGPERRDITVLVDGLRLPIGPFRAELEITHETVREVWYEARVIAGGVELGALRAGRTLTLQNAAGQGMTFPLAGSSAAIDRMLAFCARHVWAAPPPPAMAAAPPLALPPPAAPPAEAAGKTAPVPHRQARPTPVGDPASILRAQFGPHIVSHAWFPAPEGTEALAFVYREMPGGGQSVRLDVVMFRLEEGGWRPRGTVRDVFGMEPRAARFGPGTVEVTTTTLRPSDPRCCPTGSTRWVIDRQSLRLRR